MRGELGVQLGLVIEHFNRERYERNSGQAVEEVQRRIGHPVNRCQGCAFTFGLVTRAIGSRSRRVDPDALGAAATRPVAGHVTAFSLNLNQVHGP